LILAGACGAWMAVPARKDKRWTEAEWVEWQGQWEAQWQKDPLEPYIDEVRSDRDAGSRFLHRGEVQGAVRCFERAMAVLRPIATRLKHAPKERTVARQLRHMSIGMLTSLSSCYLQGHPPKTPPDPHKALAVSEEALLLSPSCVEALTCKGDSLLALGRHDEAEEALQRAKKLDERRRLKSHAVNAAAVKRKTGWHGRQSPTTSRSPQMSFTCSRTLLAELSRLRKKGGERYKAGDISAAASSYEEAREVLTAHAELAHSDDAQEICTMEITLLTNLALCYLGTKPSDPERALACCEAVLGLEPSNIKALFRRGQALAGMSRNVEALAEFTAASKINPDDPAIRRETERVRPLAEKDQHFERFLEHERRRAKEDDEEHEELFDLGWHAAEELFQAVGHGYGGTMQGETTGEVRVVSPLDSAAKNDGSDEELPSLASTERESCGPTGSRVLELAELLAEVERLRQHGGKLFKFGEVMRAIRSFEQGIALMRPTELQWRGVHTAESDAGKLCIVFHALLTNCALGHLQGEPPGLPPAPEKALRCCEEALELEPRSPKALFRKGRALSDLERHREAVVVLERTAKLRPKDAGVRRELERVRLLALDDDLHRRVQHLREEGKQCVQRGETRTAARCFEEALTMLWDSDVPPSREDQAKDAVAAAALGTGSSKARRCVAQVGILVDLAGCYLLGAPSTEELPEVTSDPRRTLDMCDLALILEPASAHAHLKRAEALQQVGEGTAARAALSRVARLEPEEDSIRKELQRISGILKRERLAERRVFEGMFEQLEGFASSGRPEGATQWPEDCWPTPLNTLGVDSVQAFANHLAMVLAEQGFAAYTMQLLHTLRHEIERHFGWGAGREMTRLVPLVQRITHGQVYRLEEPGHPLRLVVSYMEGLWPERPWHDEAEYPWTALLSEGAESILEELRFHEQDGTLWLDPDEALGPRTGTVCNLVRQGLWVSEERFPRTRALLSTLDGMRPYEVVLLKMPPRSDDTLHNSDSNCVLAAHLPLDMAHGTSNTLCVGGLERTCQCGEVHIFDHTYAHAARNGSKRDCVTFTCRFYHPGVSEVERYALLYLAELVDFLQASPVFQQASLFATEMCGMPPWSGHVDGSSEPITLLL